MNTQHSSSSPRGILSVRRFALLATTIAGLGTFALVGSSVLRPARASFSQRRRMLNHGLNRPVGFADALLKR